MRIAIFDYRVTRTNPIGSCDLRLVGALCHEHEITVFAPQFENPNPDRIKHVRIRVPLRPLVLLYISYHLIAPLQYWWHRLRTRTQFDAVQVVESNSLIRADIAYVHFCHSRYLKAYWPLVKGTGLRSIFRYWDHKLHAMFEPIVYRRARSIIVPSRGLGKELAAEYPAIAAKIKVIPNPIDLESFRRPTDFQSAEARSKLGIGEQQVVLVFVALGHFERKGLPLVLEAMTAMQREDLQLIIVGGEAGLIASYLEKVRGMGLEQQVHFVGLQRDVRPYFWMADAFVLPSSYETFSLVAFQSAAAGVTPIVCAFNGVEEFAIDGVNSVIVEHNAESVRRGIERFLNMSVEQRSAVGEQARKDVSGYSAELFDERWRAVYG